MKINWAKKLSSRKFWALAAGFVGSMLVAVNVADTTVAQVTAIITAFGSIAVYILAEAYIDGQAVGAAEEDEEAG